MSECPECARLEREQEDALEARDLSKATDCAVLIRRHPDHGEAEDSAPSPAVTQAST